MLGSPPFLPATKEAARVFLSVDGGDLSAPERGHGLHHAMHSVLLTDCWGQVYPWVHLRHTHVLTRGGSLIL